MARETATIDIQAEISDYKREMLKIPKVTEEEADKAAKAFGSSMQKAQAKAAVIAKRSAEEASDAWADAGSVMAGAISADLITGAASGMFEFISGVHEARTEIINLSIATDLQTDTLAGLTAASERFGINADEVIGSMEDFGEVLFDFEQGGGRAKEALELLEIQTRGAEGTFRKTDTVLREVLGKMSGMEDGAQKNAVAQQLFGDAGNRLNAILSEGTLEDYIALAEEYGTVLDEEAIRSTKEWNAAISELSGFLTGTAGELADFLNVSAGIRNVTLGFVFLREAAVATFDEITGKLAHFSAVVSMALEGDFRAAAASYAEGVADMGSAWGRVAESAVEGSRAFFDARKALDESTDAVDRKTTSLGRLSEADEKAAKASEKAAKEAKKAADAAAKEAERVAKAEEALGDIRRTLADDTLSQWDRVLLGYEDQIEAIEDVEDVLGSTAETAAAREEARMRSIRERHELEVQLARDLQELETVIAEAQEEQHAERMRRLEDVTDQTTEILDAMLDATNAVLDNAISAETKKAQAVADRIADEKTKEMALRSELEAASTAEEQAAIESDLRKVESTIAANELILDEERGQLRKLFEARQATEIAGVIISGAAAAIAALAPPPVGLGPVGGALLAAAIGVKTVAGVAEIRAQAPPQFHTGFPGYTSGPDEYDATLRTGEKVLNQRAAEAFGGPGAVDAANQTGQLGGGSRGPSRMNRSEMSRSLGQLLADELDTGREFSRAMRRGKPRSGVRPVYTSR